MRRSLWLTAALFLSLAAALAVPAAGPALAQSSQSAVAQQEDLTDVVFDEIEKRLIRDFFGGKVLRPDAKGKGKNKGLPPGLAKRDSLPPGLEMQLQQGGRLPPGLEKRHLPPELRARLRHRDGVDTLVVGNDVLLVRRATGLILDILRDVMK